MNALRLTVLLGGTSSERDVSFATGRRMASALRSLGHSVSMVDPASGVVRFDSLPGGVGVAPPTLQELAGLRSGGAAVRLLTLPEVQDADVVVLALHGGHGEDGTVQALLDMAGVRYTGSGHLASALAMDKDLSKRILREAGVHTADWLMLTGRPEAATEGEVVEAVERGIGYPVVVKPSKQGSTVGLSVVRRREDLMAAVVEAFRHDDEVMLERFVPGRELTVAVLGGRALPVGEIIPRKEIYDYECKYTPGMAEEIFPAELEPAVAAALQEQAERAFSALKLRGCARIDFRLTDEGESYCLEANTLPGMTDTSLVPQAAAAAGMSFEELCGQIVELALTDPAVDGEAADGEAADGEAADATGPARASAEGG